MTSGISNAEAIAHTQGLQEDSKAVLERIQTQVEETQEIGSETLASLRNQRHQADQIEGDLQELHAKLDHTSRLQNRFDRWNLKFRRKVDKAEISMERKASLIISKSRETGSEAINTIKNEHSSRAMSWSKTKVDRHAESSLTTTQGTDDTEQLTANDKQGLEQIAQTDQDLEAMLNHIDSSMDVIVAMSNQINEETKSHNKQVDSLNQAMDKANEKQAVVNVRAKRVLGRKWLGKSDS